MLNLRAKLLVGLGGILTTVLAVCLLCNLVVRRYSQKIELLLDQDYQSAVACQSMKESLDGLLDLARRSVLKEQDVTSDEAQGAIADFDQNLARQQAATDAPGEAEATDKLVDMWRNFVARYLELFQQGKSDAQRLAMFRQQLAPQARDLRNQAQLIIDINVRFMDAGRVQARVAAIHAQWIVHAVAVTTIVVAAGIAALCGRLILRPVKLLTQSVNEIAAGNLDLSVHIRSRDEIGHLASAFNEMAGQLRHFKRIDQDRLLRTQRTTQLAIDTLPDAMVILDPQGAVELSNRTANRLFGLTPGQTLSDSRLAWLSDLHRRALADGEHANNSEFRSAIKIEDRGQTRYFLPRTYPLRDSTGSGTIGVAVLLADITDFRRLDEMKNDLLSTVAHELKTPLTSMRMITHLLAEQLGPSVSPRQRELLDANRVDTDRLNRLVQDLLDIGRLESGRAVLDCRPVSVAQLVRAGVEPMRQTLESSGLALAIEMPDEDALVSADQSRICQVFANLLANALKYTTAGGRVMVAAEPRGQGIRFSVSDTGRGIPRSFVPRVFDKFFRVPGQPGDSGSGLGLTIVKDIIDAHGGEIEVDSHEGAGTTFSFMLARVDLINESAHIPEVNYAHN